MNENNSPFVSVVTPVYNGEKYLEECIESVLSQTYKNFEYIIQNNSSTDGTIAIAEKYAKRDSRIKIYSTKNKMPMIENWNEALKKISTKSNWCKVIHADDFLYPECIEKMIEVASHNSNLGIVGSYALLGNKVKFDGLPIDRFVISGKELCRLTFRRKLFLFGSPTTLLIRADIIKKRNNFYDRLFLHADTEVCYGILQDYDFGFVHQILSYTRLHNKSQTELFSKKYNTNLVEYLGMLKKYGSVCFSAEEYCSLLMKNFKMYYIFLAKNIFQMRNREFRNYQIKTLTKMGFKFSIWKLVYYFILVIAEELFNPKRAVSGIVRQFLVKSNFD
jgi:glycosyltransferase involved in cell wall biosynthesis